jgi:hypothetical protein
MDKPQAGRIVQFPPVSASIVGSKALGANHLKAVQFPLPHQRRGFHNVVALNGSHFADIGSGWIFLGHIQPSNFLLIAPL